MTSQPWSKSSHKKHKKCTQTHSDEDNKAVRGQTQTLHNNTALCKVSAGTRALHRTGAWLERRRLPLMANPQDVSRPQWPTVVRNLLMEPKWVCERHDVALWTKEYWVYSRKCAQAVCLARAAAGEDERHLWKSTISLIRQFVAVLQRHYFFFCMTKIKTSLKFLSFQSIGN